jgi:hypothetical protein
MDSGLVSSLKEKKNSKFVPMMASGAPRVWLLYQSIIGYCHAY